MLSAILMMLAAQDVPPLAGKLPPLPPPRPEAPGFRPGGRLFISPVGEPVRGPDPVKAWFDAADADHDGALTLAEFTADADRVFARLDRNHDGEIDPDDIEYYETILAPEIRTGGEGMGMRGGGMGRPPGGGRRGGGGGPPPGEAGGGRTGGGDAKAGRYADTRRGAARFGFFDYPEPITVMDTNYNRGIDLREFRAAAADRFAMLDKNHDGRLTRGELPRLDATQDGGPGGGRGLERLRGSGGGGSD